MHSPLLSKSESTELHDALHYLKVEELKAVCKKLNVPIWGKKPDMINSIMTFLTSGTFAKPKTIPAISKAKRGIEYPLEPQAPMMYGNYKNDARTRAFFKTLIGPHFHYTVYGLDWLKNRWMQGNPPTYAEFAQFWQQEYERRKGKQHPLKQEWALLNFMRRYQAQHPQATHEQTFAAWKKYRTEQVKKAIAILSALKSD